MGRHFPQVMVVVAALCLGATAARAAPATYKDVLAAGFQVRTVEFGPAASAAAAGTAAATPQVMVTLQKGQATAVCQFAANAWNSQVPSSLETPTSCEVFPEMLAGSPSDAGAPQPPSASAPAGDGLATDVAAADAPAAGAPAAGNSAGKAPAGPAAAAPSISGVLVSVSLDELNSIVSAAGYTTKLYRDPTGDYLSAVTGSTVFFLTPFSCDASKQCPLIQLLSPGIKPEREVGATELNKWISSQGSGWLTPYIASDGKYISVLNLFLTGGVTKDWLLVNINNYVAKQQSFQAFMAEK